MLNRHLKIKLDQFLDRNALSIIVLSYLFMPYPLRPGSFTLNAFLVFLIGGYILLSGKGLKADKTVLLLIGTFVAYNFLFIFNRGFSFSMFRAYAFGLLTFISIAVYANQESINRLFKGLLVWAALSFALTSAQFVGGDFFHVPYYLGYYWGVKKEALFNFFRISTPLGFNFAKTQFGGQISFLIPFLTGMWMLPYYKDKIRWYHIISFAGILAFPFSRAAWLGAFSAFAVMAFFRFANYGKNILRFTLFFLMIIFAVRFDIREHKSFDLTVTAPGISIPSYKNSDIINQTVNIGSDISVNTRAVLMKTGVRIFKAHPLGGGAGFFKEEYGQFRKIEEEGVLEKTATNDLADQQQGKKNLSPHVGENSDVQKSINKNPAIKRKLIDERMTLAPHNSYIQIATEEGIVGILIFAYLIYKVFRGLYANSLSDKNGYYACVLVGFASLLIYGFFHEIVPDRMFWIALGLATATFDAGVSAEAKNLEKN